MTSLNRHCDVKRRATGTFLVSMERGDLYLYLSSSTQISILGRSSDHPPSVDLLQKMPPVDEG